MRRSKPLPEDFDDVLVAEQNTRAVGEAFTVGGALGLVIALCAVWLTRLTRKR